MPLQYGVRQIKNGLLGGVIAGSLLYAGIDRAVLKTELDVLAQQVEETVRQNAHLRELNSSSLEDKVVLPLENPLAATVQLRVFETDDTASASSGSIVYSEQNKLGFFDNYVVCSRHGLQDDAGKTVTPGALMAVTVFEDLIPTHYYRFEIKAIHPDKDVAIIYFESIEKCASVRIADEAVIRNISSEEEVFTIGCALKFPPVKTFGEVYSKKPFPNDDVWLLTTRVTEGVSGGGVYVKKTKQLIGVIVSSPVLEFVDDKQAVQELIMSYLSFAVPLVGIGEWLDKEGLGFIVTDKKE